MSRCAVRNSGHKDPQVGMNLDLLLFYFYAGPFTTCPLRRASCLELILRFTVSALKAFVLFHFSGLSPLVLFVTYRPAATARTISSDMVACSSILTGAALLTLWPVATGGAALSTAVPHKSGVKGQTTDEH